MQITKSNNCGAPGCEESYFSTNREEQKTLNSKEIRSISKEIVENLGNRSREKYIVIFKDNTHLVVERVFCTSCHYIIGTNRSATSRTMQSSYFDVVKKMFVERKGG